MHTTFGGRLGAARKRAGFRSQEALAKRVGVERNAVSQWETDKAMPEGAVLVQLPQVLGVDANWLLHGGEGPAVLLPSQESLEELRGWIDSVLPTSRVSGDSGGLSDDRMAELLIAHGWSVQPPPFRKQGS